MKFKDKTYDYMLFCGDIHTQIDIIPNYLKNMDLSNCAVFQVGDFGIGFENELKENKRMLYLNERLEKINSDLYVIRGNHDNPKYFDGTYNKPNIFLLDDYSVVDINGWNILAIGGAISIDRTERSGYWDKKKIHNYWENEGLIFDETKLNDLRDIDIVITHSAPDFCYPLSKAGLSKWLLQDKELSTDITIERHQLSMMYEILSKNNKLINWYYGHFHQNNISYNGDTKFTAIDINTMIEHRI